MRAGRRVADTAMIATPLEAAQTVMCILGARRHGVAEASDCILAQAFARRNADA